MTQLTIEQALGLGRLRSIGPVPTPEPQRIGHGPRDERELTILQWNARSLFEEKLSILLQMASQYEIGIICISELNHYRIIPGFKCAVVSDLFTQSAIFIRHGTPFVPITDSRLSLHSERITGEAVCLKNELIVIHSYISPSASIAGRRTYWDNLRSFVLAHRDKAIILCGDLNTRSSLFDPEETTRTHSYMDDVVDSLPWIIHNDGRHTRESTALDVCMSNELGAVRMLQWEPLYEHSSDHLPCLIYTNLKCIVSTGADHTTSSTVIDCKATLSKWLRWYSAHLSELADNQQRIDLQTLWEGLCSCLTTCTFTTPVSTFWNADLNNLRHRRNRAYRARHTSEIAAQEYKTLNHAFKRLFAKTKAAHHRSLIAQAAQDPSGREGWILCKRLHPAMRGKKKKTWLTHTIAAQLEAEEIAGKFSSISNNPALDPTDAEHEEYEDLINTLARDKQSYRHFSRVSSGELQRIANSMRTRSAPGSDDISTKLVQFLLTNDQFEHAVRRAIDAAFESSTFPNAWKCAKIIPLPKPTPGDFRPISLLNILGKLVEKIVEQRIRSQIRHKLAPQQHGCRAGHNTQQALARFAHANGVAALSGSWFGAIAFDFSKAYDCVPSYKLLAKMQTLGVQPHLILFTANWLSHRSFRVYHRGDISQIHSTAHGIPQGSALSVLLWLIYINDLGLLLPTDTSNLFVDDTLLWAIAESPANGIAAIKTQAQIVTRWATSNKVTINWNKTQFIHTDCADSPVPLRLGPITIRPNTSLTYLGLRFLTSPRFDCLLFDIQAFSDDIKRRASVLAKLHQYDIPRNLMGKFTEGFILGKLRYISPLLGAELHDDAKLIQSLTTAYRSVLRTELAACRTTPIPLLHAGSQRWELPFIIQKDSLRLIISSISNSTLLGQEFISWDGFADGWSPLGLPNDTLNTLNLPSPITVRCPLDTSIRDSLYQCSFHLPTKSKALELHAQNKLILQADFSLWTDGSYDPHSMTGGAAALLADPENSLLDNASARLHLIGSSYETELEALILGLQLLCKRTPRHSRIRIYTDSQSLVTHLRAAGLRLRTEEIRFKLCVQLIHRLQAHNDLHFHWIPGHSRIGYNEFADFKANQARYYGNLLQTPLRTQTIMNILHKHLLPTATSSYTARITNSSQAPYPDRFPFTQLPPKALRCSGPLFRLRTGHTHCADHYYRFNIAQDNTCRLCSNAVETAEHLLLECPNLSEPLEALRYQINSHQQAHGQGLHWFMWHKATEMEGHLAKARRAGACL
jgi:ribonuclease HI